MRLDIHTRKWTLQKNTSEKLHIKGCLFLQDHLYVFSETGVERLYAKNDYASWERI